MYLQHTNHIICYINTRLLERVYENIYSNIDFILPEFHIATSNGKCNNLTGNESLHTLSRNPALKVTANP